MAQRSLKVTTAVGGSAGVDQEAGGAFAGRLGRVSAPVTLKRLVDETGATHVGAEMDPSPT
jgi:hypothetical protein